MHERTIELRMKGHAGSLIQVAGLVARRGFSLERLTCEPDGETSRVVLVVREAARVAQLVSQLAKLHDVLEVRRATA